MILRAILVLLLAAIPSAVHGQTGTLIPDVIPVYPNSSGAGVAANGFLCTAASGTNTPLATYQNPTLVTVNQNPVRLNAAGRPVNTGTEVSIFLQPLSYRISLYAAGTGNTCNGTTVGTLIRQVDNVYDLANFWDLQVRSDYLVYRDTDDSYKALRTADHTVVFSHATDAAVVFNNLFASLGTALYYNPSNPDPDFREGRKIECGTGQFVLGSTLVIPPTQDFVFECQGVQFTTATPFTGTDAIRIDSSINSFFRFGMIAVSNPTVTTGLRIKPQTLGPDNVTAYGLTETIVDSVTGDINGLVLDATLGSITTGRYTLGEVALGPVGTSTMIGISLPVAAGTQQIQANSFTVWLPNIASEMVNIGADTDFFTNTFEIYPSAAALPAITDNTPVNKQLFIIHGQNGLANTYKISGLLQVGSLTTTDASSVQGVLTGVGGVTASNSATNGSLLRMKTFGGPSGEADLISDATGTGTIEPIKLYLGTPASGGIAAAVFSVTNGTFLNTVCQQSACATPAAGAGLTVSLSASTSLPSTTAITPILHLVSANSAASTFLFDSFATNNVIRFRRAEGTLLAPTAVQSGNTLGQIGGAGYGATGYGVLKTAVIFYADENWSDAAQGAAVSFWTTTQGSATITQKAKFEDGLVVGAPTGDDKGVGTINVATGVYLNGTAYTNPDFGLERWFTGTVKQFANNPGAANYNGIMSLSAVESFARQHFYLPQLDNFNAHGQSSDIFQRADVSLLLHEETFIHLIELEKRIKALENPAAARMIPNPNQCLPNSSNCGGTQ